MIDIDANQPRALASASAAGFCTIDHIQRLEQIIQKYKEFNRTLGVAFIDYTNFTASAKKRWGALSLFNVNQKYINI